MYKQILSSIDGSPTSEYGMMEAIRLAKDQKAVLRFLHVVDIFYATIDPGRFNIGKFLEILRRSGAEILEKAKATAIAAGVEADSVMAETTGGRVAEFIVQEAANWPAEVIGMGNPWTPRHQPPIHGKRCRGRRPYESGTHPSGEICSTRSQGCRLTVPGRGPVSADQACSLNVRLIEAHQRLSRSTPASFFVSTVPLFQFIRTPIPSLGEMATPLPSNEFPVDSLLSAKHWDAEGEISTWGLVLGDGHPHLHNNLKIGFGIHAAPSPWSGEGHNK